MSQHTEPPAGAPSNARRLVILGANGLLGSALVRHFSRDPGISCQRFDRSQVNLGDPWLIEQTLGGLDFDLLVNCAAYTAVDDCEVQSGHAYLINGHAAGQLARLCAAKGARMIHFSTDYVFDGTKAEPYTEEDEPHPISVYGRSKLIGEQQVLAVDRRHLVIRLSWLFGPGRPAFPEWVVRQAGSGKIRVVADKIACPTYTEDVARWLRPLLFGDHACGGILNLCNPPACTWFDYAREILHSARSPVTPEAISMSDLPGLQAARPPRSALDVTKFETLTGQRCRPWVEAIADHFHFRDERAQLA